MEGPQNASLLWACLTKQKIGKTLCSSKEIRFSNLSQVLQPLQCTDWIEEPGECWGRACWVSLQMEPGNPTLLSFQFSITTVQICALKNLWFVMSQIWSLHLHSQFRDVLSWKTAAHSASISRVDGGTVADIPDQIYCTRSPAKEIGTRRWSLPGRRLQ